MEEKEVKKRRESELNGFDSPENRIRRRTRSYGYTSLKDLLPPPSPTSTSPNPAASSSWGEIPIKNPLVKHAAMAYLQPMSAQAATTGKSLLERLRDKCCGGAGEIGCLSWLCDAVSRALRGLSKSDEEEEDDDEYDDGEIDDVKVYSERERGRVFSEFPWF